jgi:hypothetical protein
LLRLIPPEWRLKRQPGVEPWHTVDVSPQGIRRAHLFGGYVRSIFLMISSALPIASTIMISLAGTDGSILELQVLTACVLRGGGCEQDRKFAVFHDDCILAYSLFVRYSGFMGDYNRDARYRVGG